MATKNWLRKSYLSGLSLVLMGIIILGVIVLAPNVRVYLEQRDQISGLNTSVATQRTELEKLHAEKERWNDKNYIISQARDRLYYVLPGEISYLVINDLESESPTSAESSQSSTDNVQHASSTSETSTDSHIGTISVDWVSSLFSSFMISGLGTPQTGPPVETSTPEQPNGDQPNNGQQPDGQHGE